MTTMGTADDTRASGRRRFPKLDGIALGIVYPREARTSGKRIVQMTRERLVEDFGMAK